MSEYKRLNKAQLQQLCEEREIDYGECRTKRDLIAQLEMFDLQGARTTDDDDNVVDGEITIGRHLVISGDADGQTPADYDVNEPDHSESVEALRLKLQIIQAQTQLERERREAQNHTRNVDDRNVGPEMRDIKQLLPMMSDDAVLSFFITYERVLQIHEVPRDFWSKYLPSQLTSKGLQTFSRLSLDDSRDYDKIKEAILLAYNLGPKWYLRKFRGLNRHGQMSYANHLNGMSEILKRYTDASEIHDFDSFFDATLLEQFVESLPTPVKTFVCSREPKNAKEAARYADLCWEMEKMTKETNADRKWNGGPGSHFTSFHTPQGNVASRPAGGFNQRPWMNNLQSNRPPLQPRGGGFQSHYRPQANQIRMSGAPRPINNGAFRFNSQSTVRNRNTSMLACDHSIGDDCNFDEMCDMYDDVEYCNERQFCENDYVVPLFLNGQEISAIRDTGCTESLLVCDRLIPRDRINPNRFKHLHGAFDGENSRKLRTAIVKLRSPRFQCDDEITVEAVVCKLPPGILCVVGNGLFRDFRQLTDIITIRRDTNVVENVISKDLNDTASSKTRKHVQRPTHKVTHDTDSYDEVISDQGSVGQTSQTAEHSGNHICSDTTTDDKSNSPQIRDTDHVNCENAQETDDNQTRANTPTDANNVIRTHADTGGVAGAVMTRRQTALQDAAAEITAADRLTDTPLQRQQQQRRTATQQAVDELCEIDISSINDNATTEIDSSAEFAHRQKQDPELTDLWIKARQGRAELTIINGLLYRRIPVNISGENEFALVVPKDYQQQIIHAAHSERLGGHQGIKKTLQKVAAVFHFNI